MCFIKENETLHCSPSHLAEPGGSGPQLIPVHPLDNPRALRSPLSWQEGDVQSKSVFLLCHCMEPG